jgi:predicted MPP superfamily phosphohydrolase
LKELLHKIEYKEKNGVWQHASRTVIFVGDYIDRGPAIREALQIVRGMNENKHAIALMGNHEYNALAYAYELPDDSFLRPHNEKNNKQHEATLKEFKGYHNE